MVKAIHCQTHMEPVQWRQNPIDAEADIWTFPDEKLPCSFG